MQVDSNSWHCRIYRWCAKNWFIFLGADWKYNTVWKYNTNLCFYMRSIILWTPLMIVVHALPLVFAWIFLWYLPSILFGVGKFYASVFGLCLAVVITYMLTVVVLRLFSKIRNLGISIPAIPPVGRTVIPKIGGKTINFFSLIWKWLQSAKHGICPEITIKEITNE